MTGCVDETVQTIAADALSMLSAHGDFDALDRITGLRHFYTDESGLRYFQPEGRAPVLVDLAPVQYRIRWVGGPGDGAIDDILNVFRAEDPAVDFSPGDAGDYLEAKLRVGVLALKVRLRDEPVPIADRVGGMSDGVALTLTDPTGV